jgi:hypothetical protein
VPILHGSQSPPVTPGLRLPQIIVEAGLVPAAPVQGAGTFILDDATNGRLNVNVLGTTTIWTDISAYVLGFTITRPSTRLQGPLFQFQAGTASITLDNSDARFDPDNLNGPYVAAGATRLIVMVPVRVTAIWNAVTYPLFSGFADGWLETLTDYEAGYSEVTLSATDVFKVLSGITLPALSSIVGAGEASGARVIRVLNSAGWYNQADHRTIAAGDTFVQGTAYGDNALSLMQIVADSEIGFLYGSPAGAVVFRNRKALTTRTQSTTVQGVFGDSGSGAELPYAAIGRADDDTTLANDIQATNVGGILQEATAPGYLFSRSYSRSDLILLTDTAAAAWAQYVLFISKTGENRFDTLTIDPLAQPDDLWPQVLGRDMGDRLQLTKRPIAPALPVPADQILDQPGTAITGQDGDPLASELPTTTPANLTVTKNEFVTGISHGFDSRTSVWSTVWSLTDASKYGGGGGTGFLTLDDPVSGRLNFNALTL